MTAEVSAHSIQEQIAACVRELAFRERVYPRWVKDKKLKQSAADYQLAVMRSVIRTLEACKNGGFRTDSGFPGVLIRRDGETNG